MSSTEEFLSAAEAQHIASLTVSTLTKIRTDQSFQLFFALVQNLCQGLNIIEEPDLPRTRKAPRRLDDGSADSSFFSETAEDWYRAAYFEALDLVIEAIKDHFDQPGYAVYHNLEELLVKGAAGEEFGDEKRQVCELYHEIDGSQLNVQLESLVTYFQSENIPVSLQECMKYLQSLSADAKSFYSEVCTLTQLILVMPATNTVFCDAPCKELPAEYNAARPAQSCHGIEYSQGAA